MPAINCYTLTLNGAAQQLSVALGTDYEVKALELQPGSANAGAVTVGGDSDVATGKGIRLEAASAGVPPAPWKPFDGDEDDYIKLSDVWVFGTNLETLKVFAVQLQYSTRRRTIA